MNIRHGRQSTEMWRWILMGGRNAHQPLQSASETCPHGTDEHVSFGGWNAGFLRLITDIHLYQKLGQSAVLFSRLGNSVSKLWTVEAVNCVS